MIKLSLDQKSHIYEFSGFKICQEGRKRVFGLTEPLNKKVFQLLASISCF